jgi:hypothetical protein
MTDVAGRGAAHQSMRAEWLAQVRCAGAGSVCWYGSGARRGSGRTRELVRLARVGAANASWFSQRELVQPARVGSASASWFSQRELVQPARVGSASAGRCGQRKSVRPTRVGSAGTGRWASASWFSQRGSVRPTQVRAGGVDIAGVGAGMRSSLVALCQCYGSGAGYADWSAVSRRKVGAVGPCAGWVSEVRLGAWGVMRGVRVASRARCGGLGRRSRFGG